MEKDCAAEPLTFSESASVYRKTRGIPIFLVFQIDLMFAQTLSSLHVESY
jgi:hypothetical protein